MKSLKYFLILLFLCSGCTIVTYNRAFPEFTWCWSKDAKMQRSEKKIIEEEKVK